MNQWDRCFYDFLEWINKKYPNKDFRKMSIHHYWDDTQGLNRTVFSIGYGIHYINYKNKKVQIEFKDDPNNRYILLTTFGRDTRTLKSLVNEFVTDRRSEKDTEIYKYKTDRWCYVKRQRKRKFNSIFLEQEKKNLLVKQLDDFRNKENWYIKNGIPYQLGILLHGPSGTGKSSLIRAIATHLNYPIYYLPTISTTSIDVAMGELPTKSLVVIEDIDGSVVTHSRQEGLSEKGKENKQDNPKSFTESIAEIFGDISGMLNSIDGIMSSHGRILVATTNHIEKLDSALLRPGRFDLKLEVGYVNKEILKQFFDHYFPDNQVEYTFNIKQVSTATLQQYILENKGICEIIDLVKE